ncbi:hypothetical protein F9279_04835 [Bacillus sp. B1-b2]|nr:hypothetical protein F9279_04835 [Bacillus sp. B1-b2]
MKASAPLPSKERNILEHLLYLPLLLTVLERDRESTYKTPFKLRKVYENLLENTIIKIQGDLQHFKNLMNSQRMKLVKGRNNGEYTEYHFYINNDYYICRYTNNELKTNTEKLLTYYFFKEGRNEQNQFR